MGSSGSDHAALRGLFLQLLDLNPEQRAESLNRPGISREMREELKTLLEADQGSETLVNHIVSGEIITSERAKS